MECSMQACEIAGGCFVGDPTALVQAPHVSMGTDGSRCWPPESSRRVCACVLQAEERICGTGQ